MNDVEDIWPLRMASQNWGSKSSVGTLSPPWIRKILSSGETEEGGRESLLPSLEGGGAVWPRPWLSEEEMLGAALEEWDSISRNSLYNTPIYAT